MQPNQPLTDKEIIIIVAYLAETNGIGYQGKLPWENNRIKTDMERFKNETMGHTVIMGRETWNSIPEKFRPLEGRQNIVVSSTLQPSDLKKQALLARTLTDAIRMASREKIFLIGGSGIYTEAMEKGVANKILATIVHADLPADRFFSSLEGRQWRQVSFGVPGIDEKSGIKIQFETFVNQYNLHLSEVF